MTTPPPDQQPAAETLEEIVDRIAATLPQRSKQVFGFEQVKSDILSALLNERERCAKVADKEAARSNEQWKAAYKRHDSSPMKVYNGRRLAAEDIAAAIREGK